MKAFVICFLFLPENVIIKILEIGLWVGNRHAVPYGRLYSITTYLMPVRAIP